MAVLLGLDAKAYYLIDSAAPSAPTGGVPAAGDATQYNYLSSAYLEDGAKWSEAACIMDVTLNLSKSDADLSCRAGGGWRTTRGTLKEGAISFDVLWDPDDAFSVFILDAFLSNSIITMLFLDEYNTSNTTVYGQGLYANFDIIGFDKSEALEDGQKFSVSLKPAIDTLTPEWIGVRA